LAQQAAIAQDITILRPPGAKFQTYSNEIQDLSRYASIVYRESKKRSEQ